MTKKFDNFINLFLETSEIILSEGKFRNKKDLIHIKDFPMFSLFADTELEKTQLRRIKTKTFIKKMEKCFAEARSQIHKMGFHSMHYNVVVKDLTKRINKNTGINNVAAYSSTQYMALDYNQTFKKYSVLIKYIIHEWAHDYMRKKSKSFKKAVESFYKERIEDIDFDPYLGSVIPDYLNTYPKFINSKIYKDAINNFVVPCFTDIKDIKDLYKKDSIDKVTREIAWGLFGSLMNICLDTAHKNNSILTTRKSLSEQHPKIISYTKNIVENIIVPEFMELSKTHTNFDNIDMYDALWTSNKRKRPSDSFAKYLYPLVLQNIAIDDKIKKSDLSGKIFNDLRQNLVEDDMYWHNGYGLSNHHEIWATAIDNFFKLSLHNRKEIVKLMYIN